MDACRLGTLMRFKDMTEERLRFLKSIGLDCLQAAGLKDEFLTPEGEARAEQLLEMCSNAGLPAVSLFISFGELNLGAEEHSGIGFAPAATRGIRGIMACREVLWAVRHNIRQFICHAGPIPEHAQADREAFVLTLRELADFIAAFDGQLLLESGQESVEQTRFLLEKIDRSNVGINFDPANLLYYNTADPRTFWNNFHDRIRAIHCKDACRPAPECQSGRETPLGCGETGFKNLLNDILASGFNGNLIIERELPPSPEQEADIASAVQLIQNITKQYGTK